MSSLVNKEQQVQQVLKAPLAHPEPQAQAVHQVFLALPVSPEPLEPQAHPESLEPLALTVPQEPLEHPVQLVLPPPSQAPLVHKERRVRRGHKASRVNLVLQRP